MFNHVFVAYAFSWLGCLYDLSIPFLLLYRKTRPFAYAAVIIFHILTAILFPDRDVSLHHDHVSDDSSSQQHFINALFVGWPRC